MITTREVRSNNTHLNILISYAYSGRNENFNETVMTESEKGIVNVMVDSGAFTIHNAKKKTDLSLDGYCKYLEKNAHRCEKYVMLDVIRNDAKTKANYETMLQRGFNPMFVFTEHDSDWSYLKDAVAKQRHLCVAGGVANKSEWMFKRYQDVAKHTKALTHGLGFVKFPEMYQLPLHSVDSTSWIKSAQAYGILAYFDQGVKGCLINNYLRGKKKIPYKLMAILEKLKITPKQFSEIKNHRNSKSIATLINTITYIEYQKYSKRLGLDLFLALGSAGHAKTILYVNEEMKKGTLTYERFVKVKL